MDGDAGGSAAAHDEVFEPLVDAAIDRAAAELDAELVALRRTIHRRPELAGGERHTAALVAERLRAAGLSVRTGVGGHGVVAVVHGAGGSTGDGPTVAYRAAMDAVPGEETACPAAFASRVPGAAHLCGHDLETAIGVGVALVLARLRDRIRGRAVLVFQPAAETGDGAAAVLAAGALDRTAPREIHALHCAPLPVGVLAAMPGVTLPGRDRFTVRFAPGGTAGAAASADLLAARLDGLSTAPRGVTGAATGEAWRRVLDSGRGQGSSPLCEAVVRTQIEGPSSEGLGVRIRGWAEVRPDGGHEALRAAVRGAVARHPGAQVEFVDPPEPAAVCPADPAEAGAHRIRRTLAALRASGALADDAGVVTLHGVPPYGAGDAGAFLRRTPGALFWLGVGDPTQGPAALPHHPAFAPDERAIAIGVRTMTALLCWRITALT